MAFDTNRFCWHGCVSTDPKAATAFYSEVIGWKVSTMQMGDDEATMFAATDDVPFAHVRTPEMEGMPSHWTNYLRVDDVDATAKAAAENGGTIVVPGTDIPPGRFAVVTSPSGAHLHLFHEADPSSAHAPDGEGNVHWVELHSKDLAADIAWMKSTFGVTVEDMPMPNGTYHILKHGDAQVGGAMTQQNPQAPAMWLTWFQVGDVDATLARAKSNGGNVLTEIMEMPNVGRMAIIQDPTGGVVGVITPPAS